jgi:hypothetical protein
MMNSKERMKSWESLSLCEQVPWETWKRILNQTGFDIDKAKLIAKKIVRKSLTSR